MAWLLGLFLPILIFSCLVLFIPSIIAIKWKSRPISSYMVASTVLFITLFLIGFSALSSPNTYSEFALPDVAMFAVLGLFFLCPVLVIIQWVGLRRFRRQKKLTAQQTKALFE